MGHTLEKYKGCDILDLNPGACLWSQKLHDFLQPRTHVLLESTPSLYSEFHDPLLEQPGSKYKLFQGNLIEKDTFDRLFESGILPHQKPLDPQTPEGKQFNNTLLVTGSLMWDPPATGMGFDSIGKQMLTMITDSARSNQRYHQAGPVRSLLWMTEDDFRSAIPRSHYKYSKFTFVMNYLAKNVQVVTPEHQPKGTGGATIGRTPQYEIQSVIRAMRRGRESGMELPPHRRENIHDFADEIARQNVEQGKDPEARLSVKEIGEFLDQQVRAGKPAHGIDWEQNIRNSKSMMAVEKDATIISVAAKRAAGAKILTSKWRENSRMIRMTAALVRSGLKKRMSAERIADQGEALFDRECEVIAMEEGPEKEAAKAELENMDAELDAATRASHHAPYDPASELTERISLKSPVPRLQWDDRPYEPLVMQKIEVWPRNRVCLLDSEPYPVPADEDPGRYFWVFDFVVGLFQNPNMSVTRALDALQPGAASLVDDVASLRDPKRGGRWNLDHLKVSMLTNEMISDLYQAYQDWPFKNSNATHSKYFQWKLSGKTRARAQRSGAGKQ